MRSIPKLTTFIKKIFKDLEIKSPFDSLGLIKATLGNEDFTAGENVVSLNSAAVIYVSGIASNFESAFEIAIEVIRSGQALKNLMILHLFQILSMNQLNKIAEVTKETVKKSLSSRPIASLEDDSRKI